MSKYEIGQEIPVGGIITITGLAHNKNGNPVYNTDRGVVVPELLLERLEMKPLEKVQPEQPKQEDKPRFKVGDKVRVTGRRCGHRFLIGEIVTLKHDYGDHSWKCSNGRHEWLLVPREFEPYTEPESTEPKQEPVKLYCTADGVGVRSIKKGDICEFLAPHFRFPNGEVLPYEYSDMDEFCRRNRGYAKANFCPLVSRPAKVGEWVLITSDRVDGTQKNEICEVVHLNEFGNNNPYLRTKKPTIYGTPKIMPCTLAKHDQYLVLDGYKPEPEKAEPEYLNMKVVCTKLNHGLAHTAGKVYEVKNGFLACDNSSHYNPRPYMTLESLNKDAAPDFIEFKGE